MKLKLHFLSFILFVFLFSCKKEVVISEATAIENETFETGVKIDGEEFNNLVIENCTFTNKGLRLGNVDSVTIRNCTFQDIGKNGIMIGFIGPASYITIENCTFERIGSNAIDSHENAPNCIIRNCFFKDIALSEIGAGMAQAHHAIYWKGKNVLITNNVFEAGKQPFGNSISVRSSGMIRNNIISGSPKNGIMYYSNHPGEEYLYIENNFLVNNAYSITCATLGVEEWHNENVVIRFNSMIQEKNPSIYISEKFENSTNFSIYGNIIVNPTEQYFRTFYEVEGIQNNLERPMDVGFVNVAGNDLHLLPSSEAIDYYSGMAGFPINDIDGDIRVAPIVNAGADE